MTLAETQLNGYAIERVYENGRQIGLGLGEQLVEVAAQNPHPPANA